MVLLSCANNAELVSCRWHYNLLIRLKLWHTLMELVHPIRSASMQCVIFLVLASHIPCACISDSLCLHASHIPCACISYSLCLHLIFHVLAFIFLVLASHIPCACISYSLCLVRDQNWPNHLLGMRLSRQSVDDGSQHTRVLQTKEVTDQTAHDILMNLVSVHYQVAQWEYCKA